MKATISLVLATIFWGLNFHFVKLMLSESSFIESASWRYILSFLVLAFILPYSYRSAPSLKIPLKGIFLVGLIGLFGFNVLFFLGMSQTSALNGSLIVSLNPITTLLLSAALLRTPVKWFHVAGALVSLLGVLFLLTKGHLTDLPNLQFNPGDLLIFAANIVFALHHIWVKKYKKDFPNLQFTAYTNLICLLGFVMISFFFPSGITLEHSTTYWLGTVGVGVFGTAIAFLLWNSGVSKIGADKAGVYMNIAPLATAISSLFLGFEIQPFHLYSGLIIIVGVIITKLKLPVLKKAASV